ncbi:hypothetical protein SAMN04487904_108116 [Actinopolyspora lacussalsi subsp. righensis]|uniref:Uncharacterized protein n=1 Tax=Actinopolyspora righensis TaxID=995060 RepID=A0A1I7AV01_9ACTN|nr:hypothetical protein SAMN04487904_108116 [Actinopolyspora righensis]
MQLLDVVVEPNPGPNHKQLGKRDVDHPPDSDHSAAPAARGRTPPPKHADFRLTRAKAPLPRARRTHPPPGPPRRARRSRRQTSAADRRATHPRARRPGTRQRSTTLRSGQPSIASHHDNSRGRVTAQCSPRAGPRERARTPRQDTAPRDHKQRGVPPPSGTRGPRAAWQHETPASRLPVRIFGIHGPAREPHHREPHAFPAGTTDPSATHPSEIEHEFDRTAVRKV